ncbi:hypothetical protein D9619_007192 [Psilocybe cf. subviscida]|uniref:Cytochrome P450 n=1 Tax=Psilocybe cf. subviscida TaxID=2480587 RepID=A0A8H5B2C7_9AGAR|nr:hypothetical protein D9619_007192 [Psilocybe cf. subviscida]
MELKLSPQAVWLWFTGTGGALVNYESFFTRYEHIYVCKNTVNPESTKTQMFQDYLPSQTALTLLIGAIIIFAVQRSKSSPLRSLPLPPGPPVTSWLSGHSSIIPATQPWKVYTKWAEKYGPVIHLRVYGEHTLILSSLDDCTEIFEKRSNLYSDRPTFTMLNLMGWDFNAAVMPYGPRWRRSRRLFQQAFKKVTSPTFRPEQTRKVNDMLYSLLTSPDDFRDHTKFMAAATSMSITYGYDIKANNDHFVNLAESAAAGFSSAILPGAALVNALPILRYLPSWFPGAGFHQSAAESREMLKQMKEAPLQWVQKNMEAGTQSNCLVSERMPACKTDGDFINLRDFAAIVYVAAADTTTSALQTFFYAMTIYPDAQKKAQQELDAVVGKTRLPNYDDWDSLSYIEALLREVLRWRPVLPLGAPHAITEDDVFKGYLIPKGSVIIPNAWAISRDESRYQDPEAFNPDRFFDKDGNLNEDDSDYLFGFGRRVCPGRHLARGSLWLSMATTLWAFNIAKARDASGNEIPVNVEYTDGLMM